MIKATIIADSISTEGGSAARRITTVECQYPRFIHGEVMTHRVFSRNAMSSRAIPVEKMIAQVRTNPAMPVHFGLNQPGMQASAEAAGAVREMAVERWLRAAESAANSAQSLSDLGIHKQVANRLLEPFQWMRTIITATEWENFFELRAHPDAQPEFQALAYILKDAMAASTPVVRRPREMCSWRSRFVEDDSESFWHLPYTSDADRKALPVDVLRKVSAARCARVSYLTHEGTTPDVVKDVELFERLVGSRPIHASPIEHQATPLPNCVGTSNNFRGWRQFRAMHEESLK